MDFAELSDAMCVYLGGEPGGSGIQVGGGEERLRVRYAFQGAGVKQILDQVLDSVFQDHVGRPAFDHESVESWLERKMPEVSEECRRKVAAYMHYRRIH
jgi:hypothetical protein